MSVKVTYKIITAGDGAVGKTTLLHRYVDGYFDFDSKMTIGVEIHRKVVNLEDKVTCDLQLWDFGGQERFRFLLDSFTKGAQGAFLMFDLTRIGTLLNLDEWVDIVRKYNTNIPIILLGSKLDLPEAVTFNDAKAEEYLKKYEFSHYLKVSSKTGQNVEKAFELLLEEILKTHAPQLLM